MVALEEAELVEAAVELAAFVVLAAVVLLVASVELVVLFLLEQPVHASATEIMATHVRTADMKCRPFLGISIMPSIR